MNDKFFDVKKEKQDRIINASLKMFALNGYRHASTDDMVREAAISKGLLFHYFGSKLGLYVFLYDYSTRFMLLEFSREIKAVDTDFFVLAGKMETARMRVMKMYPYMRRFLDAVQKEDCAEAAEAVREIREKYQESLNKYIGQADFDRFVPKAKPEMVMRCVEYTLNGLTEEFSGRGGLETEALKKEIEDYLRMFAAVFQ